MATRHFAQQTHAAPRPVKTIVLPVGMTEVAHVCRNGVKDVKHAAVINITVPPVSTTTCGVCGASWKRAR